MCALQPAPCARPLAGAVIEAWFRGHSRRKFHELADIASVLTRGRTPSPPRLASRAPRSPAPSRHAFLFAGSKSRHLDRDSCDSSALAPMSNPTTTGPIFPQPSQSTLYSSYPCCRSHHTARSTSHHGRAHVYGSPSSVESVTCRGGEKLVCLHHRATAPTSESIRGPFRQRRRRRARQSSTIRA